MDENSNMDKLHKLVESLNEEHWEEREKDPDSGKWLTDEMEKYKQKHGVESDTCPSHEDQTKEVFKEPILNWIPVENSSRVPSWNRDILPDEEIVRPEGWKPPAPPKISRSLTLFCEEIDRH